MSESDHANDHARELRHVKRQLEEARRETEILRAMLLRLERDSARNVCSSSFERSSDGSFWLVMTMSDPDEATRIALFIAEQLHTLGMQDGQVQPFGAPQPETTP